MIFIVMTLLVTSAVAAETPASIRSYTILEGENLLIICNTTTGKDIDVYWLKNETKSTFEQHGKRLEVLNIKRSFSGEYVCYAWNTSLPVHDDYKENGEDKIILVINVDVQYPAEISSFNVIPFELIENSTVTIMCDFQANPAPVWSIFNREKGYYLMSATLPGSKTVETPPVTCDYSGYWECTGSNILNYGVNVTRGDNVTVYCSPKPRSGKNYYTLTGTVGESVQLNMNAKANPPATYTWSKDDGTDISNATIQNDELGETNLTFPMLSVPYFGNYTLKMENMVGSNYVYYQILADGKPETPTDLQFSNVTYDSVTLQWTSGFDMGSRQHFVIVSLSSGNQYIQMSEHIYDNSTTHGVNQTWIYVLDKLTSDTEYNLTVVATNEHGFTSALADPTIAFRTKQNPSSSTDNSKSDHLKLILGVTLGTIATLGLLVLIVYIVKVRRSRASSDPLKESIYLKTDVGVQK